MNQHFTFTPAVVPDFFSFRTRNNLVFKSNGVGFDGQVLATLMYAPSDENVTKFSKDGIRYARLMSDGDLLRHNQALKKLDGPLARYLQDVRTTLFYSDNFVYAIPPNDIAEVYDGFRSRFDAMHPEVMVAFGQLQKACPTRKIGVYGSIAADLFGIDGTFNDLDIIFSGTDSMASIDRIVSNYENLDSDIASRTFHSSILSTMERSYRTWRISIAKFNAISTDLRISKNYHEKCAQAELLNIFKKEPGRAKIAGWYQTVGIDSSLTNYPVYFVSDNNNVSFSVTVFDYYPGVLKVGELVYIRGDVVGRDILVVPQHSKHCFIW